MKKNLIKRYSLNNVNHSYLLIKFSNYIISNTNYTELLMLDNNLNLIETLKPPLKEIGIHYTYYHPDNEQVIFQLDDDDDTLLLFNIDNYQFKLIKNPQSDYGSISVVYAWANNQFHTTIGYDDKKILTIDTSTLDVKLYSFEDRFKVAPELAKKLEIIEQLHCNRIIPGTQYFGVLDYDNTKTIKIINFQGELVRKISIANELDKNLYDSKGKVHPEKTPHEIRYQDGWFIIIWEKKIVIVSPRDNRITLYPKGTFFMFDRARFTKTAENSADFVLLTSDYSCKESSELQLYHVEDN